MNILLKANIVIGGADVNVYMMSTDEARCVSENYCKKNFPKRYEKAIKLNHKNDTLRSIAAGCLITSVLSLRESELKTGSHGKLYDLSDNVFFNVSHSGEYAAVVSAKGKVGLDIEYIKKRNFELARKICTDDEYKWVSADSEKRFYKMWTLKESVMKAVGTGFTVSPKSFSVLPYISDRDTISFGDDIFYVGCKRFDNYYISVACEYDFSDINIIYINAENLQHK